MATTQPSSRHLLLWYIQQLKLSFSAAFDAGDWLAFVATVRDILLVDIPVARLDFLDKVTLWAFAIAEQSTVADIVSQNRQQQSIFPILSEIFVSLQ